jgi:hypothetical protein
MLQAKKLVNLALRDLYQDNNQAAYRSKTSTAQFCKSNLGQVQFDLKIGHRELDTRCSLHLRELRPEGQTVSWQLKPSDLPIDNRLSTCIEN